MSAPGDPAPDFTLKDQDGASVTLRTLRGKVVVLFFYPRAHTLVCTIEACSFRDHHTFFERSGATLLGVSSDPPEKLKAFANVHHLPFPLLSDPNGKIRGRYKVPKILGLMPGRATYLVDREGIVRHVHVAHFHPKSHPREALTALTALLAAPRRTRSAGGVVLNPRGEVLVVSQFGTSWSLPKGHLEPGEDPLAAAKREILEEAGVSALDLVGELGDYERFRIGRSGGDDPSELKAIRIYLFRTAQTELAPRDPENPQARWVKPSEVAGILTHPKDREFFLGVLERL